MLNTTTASRAAANAWAEETFPDEYETRIRTNTNPSASYEFNAFTPVPYDLRLDALADEPQLATRPEQAETGPAVLDANGWTFEFSLTSNVAREDGRFGDLQLTIDSAGHAYFGRHGLNSIGEKMLESELHDAFQSLGLTGPAAVRRTYEHDSYRD